LLLALALVVGPLSSGERAYAAQTFVVNSTLDAVDVAPGNGVCAAAGGACTLRAAIQEANSLAGADSITLPSGTYSLSVPGKSENLAATGDLDITDDLLILGAGDAVTAIDGNEIDRVLQVVGSGTSLEIQGVDITGGREDFGGGGILNEGVLTLVWSTVSDNYSDSDAGGIYNNGGVVTVTDGLIVANDVGMGGAGILSSGGSLHVERTLVVENGACAPTGGVRSWNSEAVIVDSYIAFNNGDPCGDAGGVSNGGGGSMVISGTTIEGNFGTRGGGIDLFDGDLLVVNSTITGNAATQVGGGVYVNSGSVHLANSTIAENFAGAGGGLYKEIGAFVNIANSIIWGNSAADGLDCFGTIASLDYNLIGETADCTLSGGSSHDLIGADPLLGPLQDNGGPTDTRALMPGSPALDAGNPALPESDLAACSSVDQRGLARPQGTRCDIGAFERLQTFIDDDDSIFEADIEWMAVEGITKGCNPPKNDRFCPDDFVTRGQMAAFLVRALGYTDNGGGDLFVDDDASIFANDIDKLGTAGVTKGCNPPKNDRFCPDDFVTRGQMAAFLHRALGS
jgi:CSLREA domain-containing protein